MWIHVELDTDEYYIREPDDGDQRDSGKRGLTLRGVIAFETTEDHGWEVPGSSPGDEVVVLVEHYNDGDTFGSGEYMEVKGVFASETEALTFSEGIGVDHGYFGSHIAFLTPTVTVAKRMAR